MFGMIKEFLAVFTASVFTYIFTDIYAHIFLQKTQPCNLLKIVNLLVKWSSASFFIAYTLISIVGWIMTSKMNYHANFQQRGFLATFTTDLSLTKCSL